MKNIFRIVFGVLLIGGHAPAQEEKNRKLAIFESAAKSYLLALSIIELDYESEGNPPAGVEPARKVDFEIFRNEGIAYSFYIYKLHQGLPDKSMKMAMTRLAASMSHDQIVNILRGSVGSMVKLNNGFDEYGNFYHEGNLEIDFKNFSKYVIEGRSELAPKKKD